MLKSKNSVNKDFEIKAKVFFLFDNEKYQLLKNKIRLMQKCSSNLEINQTPSSAKLIRWILQHFKK